MAHLSISLTLDNRRHNLANEARLNIEEEAHQRHRPQRSPDILAKSTSAAATLEG
jgi:hypothetical protein